jgi:transposase
MKTEPFCDKAARTSLKRLLSSTKKKSDFQRVQCVWLRVEFKMKATLVAAIADLQPGTVRKIWSSYSKEGEKALIGSDRGGRRHYHLSKEEEKLFLTPFFKKAEESNVLIVAEIQDAYQERIGKKVPKSTIYRLLSRHGWKRKPGRTATGPDKDGKKTNMHEYWIAGCSQVLHPERTGNISQQWLNNTLNSMVKREFSP